MQPLLDKEEVAERLMDRVAAVRKPRGKANGRTESRIRREGAVES